MKKEFNTNHGRIILEAKKHKLSKKQKLKFVANLLLILFFVILLIIYRS